MKDSELELVHTSHLVRILKYLTLAMCWHGIPIAKRKRIKNLDNMASIHLYEVIYLVYIY
jgi:hypothetical protein